MAYRRTIEQRDRRLSRVRHTAQIIAVVAGVGGGAGIGYIAQNTLPASAATSTTQVTNTASAHPVVTHKVVAPAVKATTPVVKAAPAPVPVKAPAAAPVVCTTTPSGTTICH